MSVNDESRSKKIYRHSSSVAARAPDVKPAAAVSELERFEIRGTWDPRVQ